MIKAIIFDFGNVICHFTNQILVEKIAKISRKCEEEIFDLIYRQTDVVEKYESGLISSVEFYQKISKLCGINIPYFELKRIYSEDKFTPVKGMEELVKKLKRNYKIGLLSNTSEWDWDYMVKSAPYINGFESITKSYEARAMKPKIKIFEDAVVKLGLKPEECVFTDDVKEYVAAAKSFGLRAYVFTTTDKLMKDLEKLGLKS